MGIIDKISALVSRHTAFTLLLTLALSALSLTAIVDPLTGQMRLNIDPSANRLFSENQSAKQYYDKTRQIFGSDETLIITVASDDVFTAASIDTINRITTRIGALPAVHHVVSLANAVDIRTVDGGLDISPFSMALEDGSASPEDIKKRVLGNPLYAGNLVSKAADATALVVYFNDISDRDYIRGGIHEDITRIVAEEQGNNEIFMTGSPYFKFAMVDLLVDDLIWTPPLISPRAKRREQCLLHILQIEYQSRVRITGTHELVAETASASSGLLTSSDDSTPAWASTTKSASRLMVGP